MGNLHAARGQSAVGRGLDRKVIWGISTLDGSRPTVIDGAVNLKIDMIRKELVVSWGK